MKKTLLFAIVAALPLCAQEAAPAPSVPATAVQPAAAPCNCGCNEGKPCECKQHKHEGKPGMHGPRHHHRHPQLTEEQRAAFHAKMLEKFDTNKDGQLDDAEKEAMKAELKKHHEGKPGRRGHGPRPEGRPAPAPQQPCNCGCNEGKPCECGDNCKDAKPAA